MGCVARWSRMAYQESQGLTGTLELIQDPALPATAVIPGNQCTNSQLFWSRDIFITVPHRQFFCSLTVQSTESARIA